MHPVLFLPITVPPTLSSLSNSLNQFFSRSQNQGPVPLGERLRSLLSHSASGGNLAHQVREIISQQEQQERSKNPDGHHRIFQRIITLLYTSFPSKELHRLKSKFEFCQLELLMNYEIRLDNQIIHKHSLSLEGLEDSQEDMKLTFYSKKLVPFLKTIIQTKILEELNNTKFIETIEKDVDSKLDDYRKTRKTEENKDALKESLKKELYEFLKIELREIFSSLGPVFKAKNDIIFIKKELNQRLEQSNLRIHYVSKSGVDFEVRLGDLYQTRSSLTQPVRPLQTTPLVPRGDSQFWPHVP